MAKRKKARLKKTGGKRRAGGRLGRAAKKISKSLIIRKAPPLPAHIAPVFHGKEFYRQSAKLYTLPSQINLVAHGTPFHLINDGFVRFHAVQSTIIGWKFSILYAIIIISTFANLYLFEGKHLEIILDILLIAILAHLLLNSFLGFEASHGRRARVPIMGQVAQRIAGAG